MSLRCHKLSSEDRYRPSLSESSSSESEEDSDGRHCTRSKAKPGRRAKRGERGLPGLCGPAGPPGEFPKEYLLLLGEFKQMLADWKHVRGIMLYPTLIDDAVRQQLPKCLVQVIASYLQTVD